MNKDKVMALVKKKHEESGVSINTLLLLYFFEHFLDGIADSSYRTDLILKGGLLLSSIMGIETRTTMDMDMSMRNRKMNEETLAYIFEDIAKSSSKKDLNF